MSLGKKKFTFEYSVNWLWLIPLIGVVLIVAFIVVPASVKPALIFGTAVAAGVAALLTAVNNVDARVSAAESKQIESKHLRVCAALAFCEKWNSPDFFATKQNGREVIKKFRSTPRVEDHLGFLESDAARFGSLTDILNFFEAMSIARKQGVICDETARYFFRSILIEYWHSAEHVIKKRRAERSNARLYREFEELYNAWKT